MVILRQVECEHIPFAQPQVLDLNSLHSTIGAPDYAWANSVGMGGHGAIEQDCSISREDKGISGDAVRVFVDALTQDSGLEPYDCMLGC